MSNEIIDVPLEYDIEYVGFGDVGSGGTIGENELITTHDNDVENNVENDVENNITSMSMGEVEKLSQRIHRYIKQHKFSDAHMRYIIHLCRLEDDHYNETKTGVHLNLGKYSKETAHKLKDFVEKCESSWKEEENNEQHMKKKDRENQTIDFFKKRTEEISNEVDEKPKGKQVLVPTDINQNQSNMMINFGVDNKKIPLNRYKGIFQRIMRKSRAIKNYRPIVNDEKRKTTETLIIGELIMPVEKDYDEEIVDYDEDIENEDIENEEEYEEDPDPDIEDEEIEEEEEDIDEDNEEDEEEEDVSSIEDDDSDDFKESDSSKEVDRADLDELGERYN